MTFDSAIPAHILKGKLEDHGIECFLQDEFHVSMNPFFSNALGGIKLKVRERDEEKALRIIRETELAPISDDEGVTIVCPKCGSDSISGPYKSMKNKTGFLTFIFSFLISVYPLYYFSVYKCNRCNHEFERK